MPLRPLCVLALLGAPAMAEAPRVVADIAPVHSLAARIMQGAGEPTLLIPPGESPHAHSLRPSGAAALQGADLVLRVGDALTPGLGERIATLSTADVMVLADAPGITVLPIRMDARFPPHDHGAEEAGHADHDHEHEHDHGAEAGAHDDHDHAHEAGALDPHLWLDPANAAAWSDAIAADLAARDPANADLYAANAAAARDELAALSEEVAATLGRARGPVIVFHDAYQYFESAFDLEVAGAIAVSDAAPPGPARLAEIRAIAAETGAACLFAEPQFDPDLAAVVAEGTGIPVAVLDPLGAALTPGADLYPALLRGLAAAVAGCEAPA